MSVQKVPAREQHCVYSQVKPVKVSKLYVFHVIRIHYARKRFYFLPEIWKYVDSPTVGLIYDFSEPAPVNTKGDTPDEKQDEPDIVFDEVPRRCHMGSISVE
jgi:hypothetical protein